MYNIAGLEQLDLDLDNNCQSSDGYFDNGEVMISQAAR